MSNQNLEHQQRNQTLADAENHMRDPTARSYQSSPGAGINRLYVEETPLRAFFIDS